MARSLLAPFAVALALRLLLVFLVPVHPVWDGTIYASSADAIASGLGYVRASMDPANPGEPTAYYPVGFPILLAALRLAPIANGLDLVVQSLAGALAVIGAGLLGLRADGRRSGLRAAWLVALWPGGILLSASWLAEPFFALFVVAASVLVAYAPRSRALRASAGAALVLGFGAYVRPTAIPMAFAIAFGVAWASTGTTGGRCRALARHGLVVAAMIALAVAPWAARNAITLGGIVPVSTNGGANLFLGTRGMGGFEPLPAGLGCSGLSEIAHDRCLGQLAVARITEDPLSWLARGVLKLTHTFGHESSPAQAWASATAEAGVTGEAHALWALAIDRAFWLPFLAASIAGGVMLASRKRSSRVKVAIFAPILALAGLHFVFLGGDRYHAPVVPLMAALAAIAIGRARAQRSLRLRAPRAGFGRRRAPRGRSRGAPPRA
jgi:hypothetical protein